MPKNPGPDAHLVALRDRQVDELAIRLKLLIAESGLTQREIEARNGYRKGYLSQVLQGRIALTARHLLGVLLALDRSPTDAFDGPERSLDEIRERLARYDHAFHQLAERGLIEPDEEK